MSSRTRTLTENERTQLLSVLDTIDGLRPAVVALAPDRLAALDTAHEILRALGTDTRTLLRTEYDTKSRGQKR